MLDPKAQVIDIAAAPPTSASTRGCAASHGEYNKAGDEIRVSVWTGNKTEPSAIVVAMTRPRAVKTVIMIRVWSRRPVSSTSTTPSTTSTDIG